MTDFATMREDADGQYWVPLSDAEAAWVAEKDEAERLRAENEDLKAAVKPTDEAWLEMEAEVERLRAELEAMRGDRDNAVEAAGVWHKEAKRLGYTTNEAR